jgi:hypothetical protein
MFHRQYLISFELRPAGVGAGRVLPAQMQRPRDERRPAAEVRPPQPPAYRANGRFETLLKRPSPAGSLRDSAFSTMQLQQHDGRDANR